VVVFLGAAILAAFNLVAWSVYPVAFVAHLAGWGGVDDMVAGAYTRPLFSST
jgi:hypothetical protein